MIYSYVSASTEGPLAGCSAIKKIFFKYLNLLNYLSAMNKIELKCSQPFCLILFLMNLLKMREFPCATIFFLKSKIQALLSSFFGADTPVLPVCGSFDTNKLKRPK